MAEKCALVVDDSRLARSMLEKMLKRYEIHVDTAETAEEALDYLRHKRPDVIFMDHMMPGMDGLEAVKIIKADPKTATIPIIMYTTKEGEVYVGQARALGAIGILPKEVEPSELYQVLQSLNLVAERRNKPRQYTRATLFEKSAVSPETVEEIAKIAAQSVHADLDVTRLSLLFETQRIKMRETLLGDVKAAMQEVLKEHKTMREEAGQSLEGEAEDGSTSGRRLRLGPLGITILLALLLLPMYLLYGLYSEADNRAFQAKGVIAELRDELQDVKTRLGEDDWQIQSLGLGTGSQRFSHIELLKTVEWILNMNNHFTYEQLPFDDNQLETIQGLVVRLAASGFEGTVRLTPHFARFCLTRNSMGEWELASNELPLQSCELLGHPAQQASGLADLQSLAFGSFLASSPVLNEGKIRVDINMPEDAGIVAPADEPLTARNAGEWNRIAQRNNRVEVKLIPD